MAISLVVSRVQLDQADDALRRANAARDAAQDAVALAQSTLSMHKASRTRAASGLALAEWQLARTKLIAPTAGTVTSLTPRVGDTAQANIPLIGIVDAKAWRIIANYNESYIGQFELGDTAWVFAGFQPLAPASCQGRKYRARHQPRTGTKTPLAQAWDKRYLCGRFSS